jgi:MFS transporter, FLVCR family, feline leukemia virus subgroup C receptor-related protein
VLIGYLPLGYEFAAEQTYPESEATSACVLALGSQIFSFLFTLAYGAILNGPGDRIANWTMCGFLVVGITISAVNKPHYKRQMAGELNQ